MKLRIKLLSAPSVTHRVEVPDDASVQHLAEACTQGIPQLQGTPQPAELVLSLNKKTSLSDDRSQQLRQLGVCSGDTLWILNSGMTAGAPAAPNPAPTAATAAPPARAPASAPPSSSTPAAPSSAADDSNAQKRARPTPEASTHAAAAAPSTSPISGGVSAPSRQPHQGEQQQAARTQVQGTEDGQSEAQHEELMHQAISRALDEAPQATQAPTHLLRVLSAHQDSLANSPSNHAATTNPTTTTATNKHWPHQLLLFAAHAALSERYFILTATPATAANRMTTNASSVDAESGLAPMETDAPESTQQPGPSHATGVGVATQGGAKNDTNGSGTGYGRDGKALLLPSSGVLSLTYTYTHGAGAAASPQPPQAAAGTALCAMKAVAAGPCLILHLACRQPVREGGAGVGARPGKGNGVVSLTVDTREYIDMGSLQLPAASKASPIQDVLGQYKALRTLWVRVQDWVTAAERVVCGALNVEPLAPGLMTLPLDLKLAVLKTLEARELARVTCVCASMRDLGCDNRFWEPLFNKEFPSVPLTTRNMAAQKGFQAAYALAYQVRKERERERAMFARHHRPLYLDPPRFAPFPFQPNPFLPGGGRIIGGDYDRNPFQPGLMGMGPGLGPGPGLGLGPGPAFGVPGRLGTQPPAPFGAGRYRGTGLPGGGHNYY